MVLLHRKLRSCVIAFALLGVLVCGSSGKPKSSLSDLEIETAEVRMTLEKALEESERLRDEIQQLKEKLTVSEAAAARLTQSVAIANGEAEVFRRQSGELKLRLEAIGLDGGSGNTSKLEQRLLSAVSDLRNA